MRSTRVRRRWRRLLRQTSLAVLVLCAVLPASPPPEEKRLMVYSAEKSYSVAVETRGSEDYVALYDLLQPLGETTSQIDGHKWKLRFRRTSAEFDDRRTEAKVGALKVTLPSPPRLEGDRGLVPYAAAAPLAAHFLEVPIDLHAESRRMFIGGVAIRFTATVRKTEPAALVLNFTAPVNPTISTEPGKLRMAFRRQAVVSWSDHLTFDDPLVPSGSYSEDGGTAELTLNGTAPLMASFSDGGRTITVTTAPSAEAAKPVTPPSATSGPAAAGAPEVTPAPTAAATAPSTAAATVAPVRARYLVVIDAGHGGAERGAALTEAMAEKDVTLALAYKLRTELQNRGINSLLVRDGDSTLTLDQRAAIANESRAAVFISLHADIVGTGVRVYTSLLPASDPHPPSLLPWDSAQAPYRSSSRLLADTVLDELDKRQIAAAMLPAPLRPLNNVTAAAIAVEIAPLRPDIHSLTPNYEQSVVTAVANAVAGVRPRLEGAR